MGLRRTTAALMAVSALAVGSMADHGAAQTPMDFTRLTEAGCQRAEQLMAERDDHPSRRRAMEYLTRCGAGGGEALARELLSMSTVVDTTLLNETVREASRIRDASVLAASRDLAADQTASLEARIAALRVIVTHVTPHYTTWFDDYDPSDRMPLPTSVGGHKREGAEFEPGWWERTDSVLTSIMEDPAESEAIRWAASRARLFNRIHGPPGAGDGRQDERGAAQEPLDFNRRTEAGCQQATQIMGERGDRQARSRAMQYLARCGAEGWEAIAGELLTMRAVTDTILLNDTVRETSRIRDANILSAATALATDQAATFEARVAGLRVMVNQVAPTIRSWLRDYQVRTALPSRGREHTQTGAEFPPGWRERTDSVLTSIMNDATESEAMQWAADRAWFFIKVLAPLRAGQGRQGR